MTSVGKYWCGWKRRQGKPSRWETLKECSVQAYDTGRASVLWVWRGKRDGWFAGEGKRDRGKKLMLGEACREKAPESFVLSQDDLSLAGTLAFWFLAGRNQLGARETGVFGERQTAAWAPVSEGSPLPNCQPTRQSCNPVAGPTVMRQSEISHYNRSWGILNQEKGQKVTDKGGKTESLPGTPWAPWQQEDPSNAVIGGSSLTGPREGILISPI